MKMAVPSKQEISLTYGMLLGIADQLATHIHTLDQQPGNRVIILSRVMELQDMLSEVKRDVHRQLAGMEGIDDAEDEHDRAAGH